MNKQNWKIFVNLSELFSLTSKILLTFNVLLGFTSDQKKRERAPTFKAFITKLERPLQ